MVILQKEKNTVTISQKIGSCEISSGLDKMKSLQDMISENPSLLSEFISENLDMEIKFDLSALVNCAVRFNKDPFLKVYFSFDDNWFSFEAPKNSDSVLLVEIKYSTMLTRLFAESVYNVDKNLFYSFVEKRVLNGLQTKIKNLSKNKLTMSQVLKKDVSLNLLSNEQIMDSLPDGINYKFFKDLKKVVKDETQVARVTNAVEDKMLEFHSEVLEENKKQKEGYKW